MAHGNRCPNCNGKVEVSLNYVISLGFSPIKCSEFSALLERSKLFRLIMLTGIFSLIGLEAFELPKHFAYFICVSMACFVYFSYFVINDYALWDKRKTIERIVLNLSLLIGGVWVLT